MLGYVCTGKLFQCYAELEADAGHIEGYIQFPPRSMACYRGVWVYDFQLKGSEFKPVGFQTYAVLL